MATLNGGGDDNNDNNDHNKQQQQQPQIDDAKNFLERVKEAFKNSKGVYDRFVEIMKNFKHDRLNTGGVIKEVQDLFSGHDELFVGFQNFLPAVGLVTQDELREIQQNMTNSSNRNGGVSMHGIGNGHNNVNPDFNMAVSFICKIKQRFGSHRRIYQEFLQILQHFQTAAQANDTSVIKNVKSRIRALFREHTDLLDQFDYFLPPLTAHFSRNQSNTSTTTSTIPRPTETESTRVNGRKRRADSDLENQPDSKRRRQEDNDKRTRRNTNNSKYKRRHRSHKKNKNPKKDRERDSDMDDDDEITFSDGDISSIERERERVSDGGDEHQGLRIFSKLRKDIPDHLYKHVLTLTQLYPMGLTEFSVVGKLICDALREHGHNELMKEFQRELSSSKQSWFFRSRGQNYYEYLTNNILLKSCAAVQSSYRQLPNDVIQPRCSGRHPDAAKTLNDYYVSKPTGGENQPSGGDHGGGVNTAGGRLKSIYNENLQKSEDDLFELDMMIATNDAARKRLEQLYKTVMQQPKNVKQAKHTMIEIPPVEKRAISRLYSEHGNKVLNLLKKMPETTIPVVLKRLREKSNEWQQLKNEMKIVWKSVANKNYFKAHDFRYTIFKQYDTKRITLKNICKQIEERHVVTQRRLYHAGRMSGMSMSMKEEVSDEENEDIDIENECDANVLKYKFDFDVMHDGDRKIDGFAVDFDSPAIASTGSGVMVNGNGVICGVGLIGNASHDHIIQQMGAGLHVELGDYVMGKFKGKKINNYDYRFVICKQDILRDCARFVFQHANTSEVGKEKKEKKLFAEILESIFKEFFRIDIKEQSVEFLQNDIDSEDEDDDEDNTPSTPCNNNNNNNNNGGTSGSISMINSPDPISKIMRNIEVQNENVFDDIDVNRLEKENESIHKYLLQYVEDDNKNSEDNILIFGNKTIYALFRYLHFLYSRMNFAYKLCKSANPLYGKYESEEEIQRKYKDFLSHLSKLINGQIEDEIFEDECRKLLGIKSYELFTINRVIRYVYDRICDFDTDDKVHEFYKLFLYFRQKPTNKENRIKYFITATTISNKGNKPGELYQIEYAQNKILAISLSDKCKQSNNNINNTNNNINNTNNNTNNNNNDIDIKMSDNNTKQ